MFYKKFVEPEDSGKRIGLFRIICSILGGFISAYLSMTFLAFLIPTKIQEAAVVSIMFNTFVWVSFAVYIALAPSKLSALFRFLVPSIFFATSIYKY